MVERWITRELGPKAQVRDGVRELFAGAKALSRLVQDPPQPQTVIVERPAATSPWLVAGVAVATIASISALVLSLWPMIVR